MNVQIKQKIHALLGAFSVSSLTRADGTVEYGIDKQINDRRHTITVAVPGSFHHGNDADAVASHVAKEASSQFEEVRLNPEMTKGDPKIAPDKPAVVGTEIKPADEIKPVDQPIGGKPAPVATVDPLKPGPAVPLPSPVPAPATAVKPLSLPPAVGVQTQHVSSTPEADAVKH